MLQLQSGLGVCLIVLTGSLVVHRSAIAAVNVSVESHSLKISTTWSLGLRYHDYYLTAHRACCVTLHMMA
jgi:hypothetical protein